MTFAKACSHMTNFTCGHESRRGLVGAARFEYPQNHVESDNRLSWMLGRLYERYGDDAYYVHLIRDREATARSVDQRWVWPHSIVKAYSKGILCTDRRDFEMSLDFWDTVNSNIRTFLTERPHKATIHLEDAAAGFAAMWDAIGAEGDKDAAVQEWYVRHNARPADRPSRLRRAARKGIRITQKLPAFLREA